MPERGEIVNKVRAAQLRDFSGLRLIGAANIEKITPTDIDGIYEVHGCIDYKNRLFIFMEFKYGEKQIETGQRLALERLCDAIAGIPAYCIISKHENEVGEMIDTANAIVCERRYNKEWQTPKEQIRVKDYIIRLLQRHKIINEIDALNVCANASGWDVWGNQV